MPPPTHTPEHLCPGVAHVGSPRRGRSYGNCCHCEEPCPRMQDFTASGDTPSSYLPLSLGEWKCHSPLSNSTTCHPSTPDAKLLLFSLQEHHQPMESATPPPAPCKNRLLLTHPHSSTAKNRNAKTFLEKPTQRQAGARCWLILELRGRQMAKAFRTDNSPSLS